MAQLCASAKIDPLKNFPLFSSISCHNDQSHGTYYMCQFLLKFQVDLNWTGNVLSDIFSLLCRVVQFPIRFSIHWMLSKRQQLPETLRKCFTRHCKTQLRWVWLCRCIDVCVCVCVCSHAVCACTCVSERETLPHSRLVPWWRWWLKADTTETHSTPAQPILDLLREHLSLLYFFFLRLLRIYKWIIMHCRALSMLYFHDKNISSCFAVE